MQQSPYHVEPGFDDMEYGIALVRTSAGPQPEELKLWAKVILLAFVDCGLIKAPRMPLGSNEAESVKRRALNWLLVDKQDFPMVCEMAGVNPAVIRQAAGRLMSGRGSRD